MNRPFPTTPPHRGSSGTTLASVGAGHRARVLDLAVERAVARRLADLGLTIGSTVTVMQDSASAVILAVRGSRLALGRLLAQHIMVTIESNGSAP